MPAVDVWTFKKDTNGRWIWVCYSETGEPVYASRGDFETMSECVEDARGRGYTGDFSPECVTTE